MCLVLRQTLSLTQGVINIRQSLLSNFNLRYKSTYSFKQLLILLINTRSSTRKKIENKPRPHVSVSLSPFLLLHSLPFQQSLKEYHTSQPFIRSNLDIKMTTSLGKKELNLTQALSIKVEEKEVVSSQTDFQDIISSCAKCLNGGGIIAVPTDTIYGVACLAQNTDAVNLLYEIKQRNYRNPVAISVGTIDDIYSWGKVTVPRQLLEDLLPGPVTVVLERTADLNTGLNPHTSLIGIRIPGHKFMQDLAKESGGPIALTSANISGATSCLKVEEFETLWPCLSLVVNGGTLSDSEEARLGSTVVDLSITGRYKIIRPGSAYIQTTSCLRDKYGLQEIENS